MNQATEKRNALKKKKPSFLAQDSHKKKKIRKRWKKPRGMHNKVRLGKKGYRRAVRIGWGSPSEAKGKSKEGLNFAKVNRVEDLEGLDAAKDIVVVGAAVALKKRIQIIEMALSKNFKVDNYKDSKSWVEAAKKTLDEKRKKKQDTKKEREERRQKREKESEKKRKEKKEEEKTVEDKDKEKKEEKKDQEKILMTKQ